MGSLKLPCMAFPACDRRDTEEAAPQLDCGCDAVIVFALSDLLDLLFKDTHGATSRSLSLPPAGSHLGSFSQRIASANCAHSYSGKSTIPETELTSASHTASLAHAK